MVLPEKLLSVGIGLGSLLSPVHAAAAEHRVLKLRDLGGLAGSSTTDLVRFSGTLKVARGIVEEHKRSDIIEVPTSGLVSILDRIKALEKEVQDLLDGKKVNKDSKAIEPSASDSASSGSASSSPDASSSAGVSSGGSDSESSAKDSSPGSASTGSDSPPSDADAPGSSPAATASDTASSGGSSGSEDDCAPERLLYHVGAGSLQRRSMTVSDHPLFRRNSNCTLDSVSGGKKDTKLPGGAAVFKESSVSVESDSASPTNAADSTESTNAAILDTSSAANSAANKALAPESQAAAPSPASVDDGAVKLDGHSLSVTSLYPAATAGLGSKVKSMPSESDDESTTTTTMTSTSYTTTTIYLRPTATKVGFSGKFLNNTTMPERVTSGSLLLKNGTAIPTGPRTTSTSAALAGQGGLVQDDETPAALTGAPIFLKNATAPTSSDSSLGSSQSNSSSTTGLSSSNSSSNTTSQSSSSSAGQPKTTITPTATRISLSDPDSITILPVNEKNVTFPLETSSIPSSETSSMNSTPSANSTTSASQPIREKNIAAPTSQATTSSSSATSLSAEKQSSSAPQSVSSSMALMQKMALSESLTRTSTVTSTVSITVPAAGRNAATSTTSSSSSSGGAATEPEATTTTAALASRPAFLNGTLDKRQSGFKTVRTLRRRTAVADEQC